MKGRTEGKRGMESGCIVLFVPASPSSNILLPFSWKALQEGGYHVQVIGLDSCRDQASPLPVLSHCCQGDSRKTYAVLDRTVFGLFKMHLVGKSYKF